MIIGCPTEIKAQEGRVGVTPAMVYAFVKAGHRVLIQKGAGLGSGFPDEEYAANGAEIIAVLKGDAYGCGIAGVYPVFRDFGIKRYAVAIWEEEIGRASCRERV